MPLRSKLLGTLAGFAIAATAAVAPSVAAAWAPADSAAITPGNMTFTDGAQCTSNFIFQGATDVYIGQAAWRDQSRRLSVQRLRLDQAQPR
jgi:hypothetical protein